MAWTVLFHSEFDAEYDALSQEVQNELLARLEVLKQFGPRLGRPTVDTLKASSFPNMKELRFNAEEGVWRFAFAFDPHRQAVILVGGDKAGKNQGKFYKALIEVADERFAAYVKTLEPERKIERKK
jgi:hypothetical protein